MILVVSANPALDHVAVVDFKLKGSLRPIERFTWPGGSGIHAGVVAASLGSQVTVLGFAGGATGNALRKHLDARGIAAPLLDMPNETRLTYSVVDRLTGNICDIADRGLPVPSGAGSRLLDAVVAELPLSSCMIVSGSLPEGIPHSFVPELVGAGQRAGVPVIADLRGPLLRTAVDAGAWLVKPSLEELLEDHEGLDALGCLLEARSLARRGANACVSLGRNGLLWIRTESALHMTAPHVAPFNPIGSGDTFVGALAHAHDAGQSLESCVAVGVAAASANVSYVEPGRVESQDVTTLLPQVGLYPVAMDDLASVLEGHIDADPDARQEKAAR